MLPSLRRVAFSSLNKWGRVVLPSNTPSFTYCPTHFSSSCSFSSSSTPPPPKSTSSSSKPVAEELSAEEKKLLKDLKLDANGDLADYIISEDLVEDDGVTLKKDVTLPQGLPRLSIEELEKLDYYTFLKNAENNKLTEQQISELAHGHDGMDLKFGRQLLEDEFIRSNLGGFNDQPALGPHGTMEHPAMILSNFPSRLVACKGYGDYKHRLLWFDLKEGPKHVCQECAQVFLLVNPKNWEQHADAFHVPPRAKGQHVNYRPEDYEDEPHH